MKENEAPDFDVGLDAYCTGWDAYYPAIGDWIGDLLSCLPLAVIGLLFLCLLVAGLLNG